jgi:steroid 5-alpha reductase family enzyme
MIAALALFISMHLWFIIAMARRRNDVADVAWGLGFVLLAVVEFARHLPAMPVRSLVLVALVAAWGFRLSIYIGRRSLGQPEDPRYTEMRNAWGASWRLQTYLKVFWLQGLLLFVIAQPLLAVLRLPAMPLNGIDQVAESIALFGLIIEAIADFQKGKFKADPKNKGRICDIGLWSKSRHPNYFGEMVFWIGISTFTLHKAESLWWVWISPALLIFLLLKVSGVPLIEKRYAGNKKYADYRERTNLLIPIR